ncbi:hypothetical protein P9D43_06370 [Neobacillus niacini]|uniref:DUF6954 family protein n=1 Tax=Neobacillus niacini TaxID=86668 RepID=UPI0007AB81F1|nr:hypothetical protein [Neobacillus niacini]MEC1521653.1 hypothetical protein [Neobacillus niacini]
MKLLIHACFIILLLLVTFFGVGPVLYADGVLTERLLTAAVVVILYATIGFLYSRAIKWIKRK